LKKFTRRWVPISYRSSSHWEERRNPKVCWSSWQTLHRKAFRDHYGRWILIRLLNRLRHDARFLSCWSDP
jgi:hypothetical protein